MASAGRRCSGTIPSLFTPHGLKLRHPQIQILHPQRKHFTSALRVLTSGPHMSINYFQVNSPPGVTQTQRPMSGTTGASPSTVVLGLGLDLSGPWHQRVVRTSGALVQTYLLTSSVNPPPTAGGGRGSRTPLRLPSLVSAGPRRRSSMARLSLSEPSLLTTNENVLFEGFSGNRRLSVLQKRPPPPPPFSKSSVLLPCKACHPSGPSQPHQQQQARGCSRSTFIHFSQAIQPSSKPRPARRHSHNPALSTHMVQGDLRPSVTQQRDASSQGELLSVVGKPCLLSSSERPTVAAAAAPARTQLHVFLPTEAEGEDSESVDEGFMDELDNKITSLKLQQGAPKTLTYH